MSKLTHLDEAGRAVMVNVSHKPDTQRVAIARGSVAMQPETIRFIREGTLKKGDALAVARIAGMMAAKRTADLIPLCHPLQLTHIAVDLTIDEEQSHVLIEAQVSTVSKTGVEMEALTAVSVAALTIYDMAKSVDHTMRIEAIRLVEKRGGQSGDIVQD